MERQRLLIIEDQEAIASQLRWALSDEYDVSVAGTGKGGGRPRGEPSAPSW